MFCTNCGKQVEMDAFFCHTCGERMGTSGSNNQFGGGYTPNTTSTPAVTNTPRAPGRMLLKVTGIILIVLSGGLALGSLFNLFTIDTWLGLFGGYDMRGTWQISYTISILWGLYGVIAGIMGLLHCSNVHKGEMLRWLGIIYIAVWFISLIVRLSLGTGAAMLASFGLSEFEGFITIMTVVLAPIDLVLPILFIIGATKNIKAAL